MWSQKNAMQYCAKLGAVTTAEDVNDTIAHPAHCSLQITVMYEVDKYFIHCYIPHTWEMKLRNQHDVQTVISIWI